MNTRRVGVLLFVAAGFFCGFTLTSSNGIVGVTRKPNHIFVVPGCFCHADTVSPGTRVWIQGPDSVRAGAVGMYTINVARARSIAAGFNVAAFFGSLGIVDSTGTQLLPVGTDSLELTHVFAKLARGRDTISWPFSYRAPLSAGRIDTLYACGNSVDTSYDPTGDAWNFAPNLLVRILPSTGVAGPPLARSVRLLQNYPNPFNPSTVIRFELPAPGLVRLTVHDVAGRPLRELVNEVRGAGVHDVVFGAERDGGLASGLYLYRLTVRPLAAGSGFSFTGVGKMLLVK